MLQSDLYMGETHFYPFLVGATGSILAILLLIALTRLDVRSFAKVPASRWAGWIVLGVAYWLTAALGLQWASVDGAGSPVWPAAGVGLAGLLLGGIRLWPAIVLGRLAAAITTGSDQPLGVELVIGFANAGSLVITAILLTRWMPTDRRLTAIGDVLRLAMAITAGSMAAAIVGTGALMLANEAARDAPMQLGIRWWLGSTGGALLVAPIILSWSSSDGWRMGMSRWLGLGGLIAATAVISNEIFLDPKLMLRTWYVYPVLIWVAVVYQVRGASVAMLVVGTAALWSGALGVGTFSTITTSQMEHILLAQQFTIITSVAVLILAAAADERRGLEALRHREARENSIVDTAVDPIVVIDKQGTVVFCNPAVERSFGYEQAELLGNDVGLLIAQPDQTASNLSFRLDDWLKDIETAKPGCQALGRRKDGTTFPLDLSITKWRSGLDLFFTCMMRDQTERAQAEIAVRASERRLAVAIAASGGAVYEQTVPASEDIYVSRELLDMFGYDALPVPAAQIDFWLLQQIHPDDRDILGDAQRAFLEGEAPRFEVEARIRRADGLWLWVRSFAQAIERDDAGHVKRLSGMVIDITDRKLTENRVEHLARHDSLTGIANRTSFIEHLAKAARYADIGASQAGLILIDLDYFKTVNDTHGHPVGDALLLIVTERLTSAVRSGDTVARLGGDEFAVVVPHAHSHDDVHDLADRLRNALVQPAVIGGVEVEVSASIGFAMYSGNGETVEDLMRHADLALYEAKAKGRSRVQGFCSKLEEAASYRIRTETALRRAIRNEELTLHYQPQFNFKTGRVECVEALVRWSRDGKLIGPDEFIPVAEGSSLIRTLGAWVIREACRQQAAWRSQGIEVNIAVNVSASEAGTEDFITHLDRMLTEFGVPSDSIELEITEGFLMDPESKPVQSFLTACGMRGIRLAIDDFGMGYSSLSYLARLPISKIKIDRSFVMQIDRPDEALIEAVVTLGRRLGKRVVAEGVETKAQMDFLRYLGCDDAQGYLFCRPGSASDITPLLSQPPIGIPLRAVR